MLVTRKSSMSGKVTSMEIDVTEEQMNDWKRGALIQDAMPTVSADEREFILTGITPKEWNTIFGDEE